MVSRACFCGRSTSIGLALLVSVILALATVILLEQWDGARVDPYVSKRIGEIVDAFEKRKGGSP